MNYCSPSGLYSKKNVFIRPSWGGGGAARRGRKAEQVIFLGTGKLFYAKILTFYEDKTLFVVPLE